MKKELEAPFYVEELEEENRRLRAELSAMKMNLAKMHERDFFLADHISAQLHKETEKLGKMLEEVYKLAREAVRGKE